MTANITSPNGLAVSKTFTVARSAAGDQSAVLFLREGADQTAFPKVEFSSTAAQRNGSRGRKGVTTILIPFGSVDANGVFTKRDDISVSISAHTPDTAPDAIRNDAAAYVQGIVTDVQIKDLIRKGFAA